MKNKVAPGADEMVLEDLNDLDELRVEKVSEIVNEIYDSGEIPNDLIRSIFITLPKKPGASDVNCMK
jgi:hypothetical protein